MAIRFFQDYGAQRYDARATRRTGNPYDGFSAEDLRQTMADYERRAQTGLDDREREITASEIRVIEAEIAKMRRSLAGRKNR